METYYITGGTGHLGKNIVIELLKKENINIVILVLKDDKHRNFIDPSKKITFVEGDVLDTESLDIFFNTKRSDINYCIHAAGLISIYKKRDEKVFKVNTEGTKNMVDLALKNKIDKFIYVSSVDCITKPKKGEIVEPRYYDETMRGVYAQSKAIASNYCLNSDLNTIIVHPSAILGREDPFGGPINTALKMYLKGKLKTIVDGGYNLVDVRDVARGIVNAIDYGVNNENYILSGTNITIKELIDLSSKITHLPSYKRCVSTNLVKIVSPILELYSKLAKKKPLFTAYSMDCLKQNYNYSSEKAKNEIHYTITPIEETLKDTFEFLKSDFSN